MLPSALPRSNGKQMEKDGGNVGGLLMDLAENGVADGTSTAAEKGASTITHTPTNQDDSTIPPAANE
jgi:hypothetical protein